MDYSLPEPFQSKYAALLAEFEVVRDTYAFYADGIIPTDAALKEKILAFLIEVLDYIEINYEKIAIENWTAFLCTFTVSFGYGNRGERRSYLEFEDFDLVSNLEKFRGEDAPDLKRIVSVRKKLEKALQA